MIGQIGLRRRFDAILPTRIFNDVLVDVEVRSQAMRSVLWRHVSEKSPVDRNSWAYKGPLVVGINKPLTRRLHKALNSSRLISRNPLLRRLWIQTGHGLQYLPKSRIGLRSNRVRIELSKIRFDHFESNLIKCSIRRIFVNIRRIFEFDKLS